MSHEEQPVKLFTRLLRPLKAMAQNRAARLAPELKRLALRDPKDGIVRFRGNMTRVAMQAPAARKERVLKGNR